MIQIFHNPRCRKSREGIAFLEDAKVDFEIIKYLDTPPTLDELKTILSKLDITPIELVRKTEVIWKENFKGKELTDDEIIEAMVANPKLIERPIIINESKAVIGRPKENIQTIL